MSAALASPHIDRAYYKCWAGLRSHFCREVTANGAAAHAAATAGLCLHAWWQRMFA